MNIIVTGASGLIGTALVRSLLAEGHGVTRLVRGGARGAQAGGARDVAWDPERGAIDAAALEGHDGAVHLAGESIADGRWTDEKKRRIRESRVRGTTLLAETLARLGRRPRVLVSASAVGYYGDRGGEVLTEESPSGNDFLAEVCREWERATEPARRAGIRVVPLRIGVVLSGEGGALARMLTPFRMGVGGRIGSGEQFMSWIALDDVVGVIRHALTDETLDGPVNATAPTPVTNAQFTAALGRVLGRPTFFAVPAFAARLAFGEVADALLLSSARVEPARLLRTDFRFRYPDLEAALRHVLGKDSQAATR